MTEPSIDVVYIGGFGRSGSTLLLRLLGALDGSVPTGEMKYFWTHHMIMNQACGCGKAFRDCEFWNAVIDDAFGGMDGIDPQRVVALQESVELGRQIPLLAFPQLRTEAYERRLREYAEILGALYRSIQRVSGCNVIIDSSKRPSYALMLSTLPEVRTKVIHLVRDSRACAFSWQRKKRRADPVRPEAYMRQIGSLHSSIQWDANKLVMPLVARRSAAYATYRYEDFAAEPRRVLQDVINRLDLGNQTLSNFVSDTSVLLEPDHTVFGNPNRFEHGAITIQSDDEWQHRMSWTQKSAVTALTLPFLWKYGYLGHDRPRPNESMAVEPSH